MTRIMNIHAQQIAEQQAELAYYEWYGQKQKLIFTTASGLYDLWLADNGDSGHDPEELWNRAVLASTEATEHMSDGCPF
jgi:hypothetical protein